MINIFYHDLIGFIWIIHGFDEIPGIIVVGHVAKVAEEKRAVIGIVNGMFSAVEHFDPADHGQQGKEDGDEQEQDQHCHRESEMWFGEPRYRER